MNEWKWINKYKLKWAWGINWSDYLQRNCCRQPSWCSLVIWSLFLYQQVLNIHRYARAFSSKLLKETCVSTRLKTNKLVADYFLVMSEISSNFVSLKFTASNVVRINLLAGLSFLWETCAAIGYPPYLARSGSPVPPVSKPCFECHKINPLLTKFFRWLFWIVPFHKPGLLTKTDIGQCILRLRHCESNYDPLRM